MAGHKNMPRLTGEARAKARDEAAARYNAGESVREIAKAGRRSYGATHRLLTEARVELRPRGGSRGRKAGAK